MKKEQDGLFFRFIQYLSERFPLHKNGILLLLVFSAIYGINLVYGGVNFAWGKYLAGFCAYLTFFLHLRLMDEFKDFAADSQYMPWRPVPRGLISLDELGRIMVFAIALEVIFSFAVNINAVASILAAAGYSFLMFKEFFLAGFLKRHIYLYAITHALVVVPLVYFNAASAGVNPGDSTITPWLFVIVFSSSFMFEIARKVRRPHEEQEGVETYTSVGGEAVPVFILVFLSMALCGGAVFFTGIFKSFLFYRLFYPVMTGVYTTAGLMYLFLKKYITGGKFIENLTRLYILMYYLVLNLQWLSIYKG